MAMPPGGLMNPPAPPTATQEPSPLPEPVAFGREIAAAREQRGQPEPDQPQVTASPPQAGVSSHTADRLPPTWSHLPPELLQQLLLYLPLSSLNSCALVCRHWYANLPAIRMQLARWLSSIPYPQQSALLLPLADGYSSRSRPWLARHHYRLLPLLDRQYAELLRLRKQLRSCQRGSPQQQTCLRDEHRARTLLSGLIRYSLHHQMIQIEQLTLQPIGIRQTHRQPMSTFHQSFCGRWLAAHYDIEDRGPQLSIHALRAGCWKEERLVPRPATPLIDYQFSISSANRLVSAHPDHICSWDRQEGTDIWQGRRLQSAHKGYQFVQIMPMASGDLLTLSRALRGAASLLQILPPSSDGAGQAQPLSHFYTAGYLMRPKRVANLLALAMLHPQSCPGGIQIHVWYRIPLSGRTSPWSCQVSTIKAHHKQVTALSFSPDGRQLLILLSDGQVCLSTLNAQHELQEQMTLRSCLDRHANGHTLQNLFQSNNGEQLALPLGLHQIQLWHRDENDRWQAGQTVEVPPDPADVPGERLLKLYLLNQGSLLVRHTTRQVNIWHLNNLGHWQPQVQRKTRAGAPAPCVFVNELAGVICTKADDPGPRLWIHGTDQNGRLIKKADRIFRASLPKNVACPDGLLLVTGSRRAQVMQQLVGLPTDAGAPRGLSA
ncbi:MAG: WD40 repeat domain-containing protein [Kistimonas sp.]|nr:WD40 repeat domain-containing protein [Kistimonas sp.]